MTPSSMLLALIIGQNSELLTENALAKRLKISPKTLRAHIRNGEFVFIPTGEGETKKVPAWQIVIWGIGKSIGNPNLNKELVAQLTASATTASKPYTV